MPTDSSASLPASLSPTRKALSSQHNVWNKLLLRAEKRAPQPQSHFYLPTDPGENHLRASFENHLINQQLQIDAVFRIPVHKPGRPYRKAAKRYRPRQNNGRSQRCKETLMSSAQASEEDSEVVLLREVRASRSFVAPSANESYEYVVERKKTDDPSDGGKVTPLSEIIGNDRISNYGQSMKPPIFRKAAPKHITERPRNRVSKSTPFSANHTPLSSLETSEDSPTLYSCDSVAIAPPFVSSTKARIDDSSLGIVSLACNRGTRVRSGAKRASLETNSSKQADSDVESEDYSTNPVIDVSKDGRVSSARRRQASTKYPEICCNSLFSSSIDDMSGSQRIFSLRPGYAFRKTVQSIFPTRDCDDSQDSSESGIFALPPDSVETCPKLNKLSRLTSNKKSESQGHQIGSRPDQDRELCPPRHGSVGRKPRKKRMESQVSSFSSLTRRAQRSNKFPDIFELSVFDSNPRKKSNRKSQASQRTETLAKRKCKTHSKNRCEIRLCLQDGEAIDDFCSEIHNDGCLGEKSSSNITDNAAPGSNIVAKEIWDKRHGSEKPSQKSDLHSNVVPHEHNITSLPSIEKKLHVSIFLKLRIKQPKGDHTQQKSVIPHTNIGAWGKHKSRGHTKPRPGRESIDRKGGKGETKSTHREKFSASSEYSSLKDQGDVSLVDEPDPGASTSTLIQRYPLRSSKQRSKLDSKMRISGKRRVNRGSQKCGDLQNSPLNVNAVKIPESCRPSHKVLDSPSSAKSVPLILNNVQQPDSSPSSDDILYSASVSRVSSHSTEPTRSGRRGVSPKRPSAARLWTRDATTARVMRMRGDGDKHSKIFGSSATDIAVRPLKSLRKRRRGKASWKRLTHGID